MRIDFSEINTYIFLIYFFLIYFFYKKKKKKIKMTTSIDELYNKTFNKNINE